MVNQNDPTLKFHIYDQCGTTYDKDAIIFGATNIYPGINNDMYLGINGTAWKGIYTYFDVAIDSLRAPFMRASDSINVTKSAWIDSIYANHFNLAGTMLSSKMTQAEIIDTLANGIGVHGAVTSGLFQGDDNNIVVGSTYSMIGGGFSDSIKTSSDYSGMIGGQLLKTTTDWVFMGGGSTNSVSGNYATIIGGLNDTTSGGNSAIIAGGQNKTADGYSVIAGGLLNKIPSNVGNGNNFIGGGTVNVIGLASQAQSNNGIVAGNNSILKGNNGFVGGGSYDSTTANSCGFVASTGSYITGQNSVALGAYQCQINGSYSTIVNGYRSYSVPNASMIFGQYDTIYANAIGSIILGNASKIRAAAGDSNNFVVYGIVDSCMRSGAFNTTVKLSDSTWAFSKQIWVRLGNDTTRIGATGLSTKFIIAKDSVQTPKIHNYSVSGDIDLNVETDKTDGYARAQFQNDVMNWTWGVEPDDSLKLVNQTDGRYPFAVHRNNLIRIDSLLGVKARLTGALGADSIDANHITSVGSQMYGDGTYWYTGQGLIVDKLQYTTGLQLRNTGGSAGDCSPNFQFQNKNGKSWYWRVDGDGYLRFLDNEGHNTFSMLDQGPYYVKDSNATIQFQLSNSSEGGSATARYYLGAHSQETSLSADGNNHNVTLYTWFTDAAYTSQFVGYKQNQCNGTYLEHEYFVDSTGGWSPMSVGGITRNGDWQLNGDLNFGTDGGSTDAYGVTINGITKYKVGLPIWFKANTANTGACSIDINGMGLKSLKSLHDQDPADNYIEVGSLVHAVYDGSVFQILTPDANP